MEEKGMKVATLTTKDSDSFLMVKLTKEGLEEFIEHILESDVGDGWEINISEITEEDYKTLPEFISF